MSIERHPTRGWAEGATQSGIVGAAGFVEPTTDRQRPDTTTTATEPSPWLNGDAGKRRSRSGLYDTPPYQQMPAMTDATLARTRSLSGQPIQRCDPTAMRATRNGVKSSEYRKPYWTKPPP
jgi:hypothetical protein